MPGVKLHPIWNDDVVQKFVVLPGVQLHPNHFLSKFPPIASLVFFSVFFNLSAITISSSDILRNEKITSSNARFKIFVVSVLFSRDSLRFNKLR